MKVNFRPEVAGNVGNCERNQEGKRIHEEKKNNSVLPTYFNIYLKKRRLQSQACLPFEKTINKEVMSKIN